MTPSQVARTYIGQLEKPGNSGFQDPNFEIEMRNFGEWLPGYSWCCCFAQLCFHYAYPEKADTIKKLFSPSTRETFNNFKKSGYKISQDPIVDSLVIFGDYENGVLTWQGHAGIVSSALNQKSFKSIEGNTSGGGSRNGDRVFEHIRNTNVKSSGLNVLGFITI